MNGSILGRRPPRVPSSDGRSADAVLLRRTKAELTDHVGGNPSATQRALIDRAAHLTLHLARMDTAAARDGGFNEWTGKQYLAWSNTLTRTLAAIGIKAAPPPATDLAKYLESREAA